MTHPTSWRRLLLDRTRWRATAYASICALWATFIGAVFMSVLSSAPASPALTSSFRHHATRWHPAHAMVDGPERTGIWLLAALAGLVLAVAPSWQEG